MSRYCSSWQMSGSIWRKPSRSLRPALQIAAHEAIFEPAPSGRDKPRSTRERASRRCWNVDLRQLRAAYRAYLGIGPAMTVLVAIGHFLSLNKLSCACRRFVAKKGKNHNLGWPIRASDAKRAIVPRRTDDKTAAHRKPIYWSVAAVDLRR
jgi:hypothetical protein